MKRSPKPKATITRSGRGIQRLLELHTRLIASTLEQQKGLVSQ